LGAADASTGGGSALQEQNNQNTTNVDAIDKTSKAFVKLDNTTPAIDAEASVSSLDAAGFTLSWSTNDAVATEIGYLPLIPRRRGQGGRRPTLPASAGDDVTRRGEERGGRVVDVARHEEPPEACDVDHHEHGDGDGQDCAAATCPHPVEYALEQQHRAE